MNIDISNANCGRGHSPDHACLRVGFLAIAELSFGALGRRRGDVLTGVPTLRRLKSRPRCATVRGPFRVPADAVALSGGSSHPSSADGRWLGRSLCSLDLVASSAFGTSLWSPLPCGSAVTHGRCSAARPGEEAAGPHSRLPASSGVERVRPATLVKTQSLSSSPSLGLREEVRCGRAKERDDQRHTSMST